MKIKDFLFVVLVLVLFWYLQDFIGTFFGKIKQNSLEIDTMIACEQLDRTCYMMELDPHYCDVIVDRWEKLTGETADKIT